MAKQGRPIPWEADLADFILEEMRHNDRFIVEALESGLKVYDTWNSGKYMDTHSIKAYKAKVELERGEF